MTRAEKTEDIFSLGGNIRRTTLSGKNKRFFLLDFPADSATADSALDRRLFPSCRRALVLFQFPIS